jgi:DNA primase
LGRIPDHVIDRIRETVDIVELVGSYVPLRRSGRNFKALCPFHQEKTPSFQVSPEKQIFYCFGCHRGGNVFSFLMEHDGVSFPEAVRDLGRRTGIPVPEARSEAAEESRDAFYQSAEFAASFYRACLEGKEGREARDYLRGRGLTEETREAYRLGWAPEGWERLHEAARAEGFLDRTLLDVGLVQPRSGGSRGCYDTFRGRVVFPILNLSRRVVGFGARRLDDDDSSPKYINSRDSVIFSKGRLLYGLHRSRDSIRREGSAVLVEGYMDFLAMVQAGLENVAACCGTAFTADQARVLARYAEDVVILADADAGGTRAAVRMADVLVGVGIQPRVCTLPEGDDPDSFLAREGPGDLAGRIQQAEGYFAFVRGRAGESFAAQERALRHLIGSAARVGDPLKVEFFLKELSDLFNVNRVTMEGVLREAARRGGAAGRRPPQEGAGAATPADRASSAGTGFLDRNRSLILTLLRISLEGGERGLRALEALDPDWLEEGPVLEVFKNLEFAARSKVDLSRGRLFRELTDPELVRTASEIAFLPLPPGDLDLLIGDYSRRLALESSRDEMARLRSLIDEAYLAGKREEARRYQSQLYKIKDRTASKGRA